MTGQEATDGWDSDQQFIKDTHRLATAAERKRCVSVLVRLALIEKRKGWEAGCGLIQWRARHSAKNALMQAARAISPKVAK